VTLSVFDASIKAHQLDGMVLYVVRTFLSNRKDCSDRVKYNTKLALSDRESHNFCRTYIL